MFKNKSCVVSQGLMTWKVKQDRSALGKDTQMYETDIKGDLETHHGFTQMHTDVRYLVETTTKLGGTVIVNGRASMGFSQWGPSVEVPRSLAWLPGVLGALCACVEFASFLRQPLKHYNVTSATDCKLLLV